MPGWVFFCKLSSFHKIESKEACMDIAEITTWVTKYQLPIIAIGSLLGLAIIAYVVRIAFNGIWKMLKGDKYTWTTKGGRGTTFITNSRALKPTELSSRQKNMGETTYVVSTVVLLSAFILCGLYALGILHL